MSRSAIRSAIAVLALVAGLALAAPNAEAAERAATQEPGVWSLALHWAAQLWEENVVNVWETEGWGIDPNGNHATAPPDGSTDEGDSNG
ncbi:MAG TPA: hypothetical protein VEW48_09075 [Thermoanaerobaculia bacterium]|nr:hypothetical protein [Thermoanaerobaculia bacterium]